MEFYDEHGQRVDHLNSERDEQLLATQYVDENSKGVLELGARYGTVTCAISTKLRNRPVLVSVEPDYRVWDTLDKNLERNHAVAHLVKGTITRNPQGINAAGYSTNTYDVEKSQIANWTLEQIMEKYNLQFDTLVADCEGFLEKFLDENPRLYDELNTIIFEADMESVCNYSRIRWMLHKHGMREVHGGFQNVWKRT